MMNTHRGMVFKKTSSYSIFLTSDGRFIKGVPLITSVQVGEEAFFQLYQDEKKRKLLIKRSWTQPVLVLVATIILLFSVLLPSQSTVSAFVQIDINPSIELGIDNQGKVYLFKGLNDEGVAVKRDISFWKGKPLAWVLLQIVDRTKFIIEETEIIEITTIYQNEENHANLEKVVEAAVKISTSKVMTEKQTIKVNKASVADREAANAKSTSVQKYHAEPEVIKKEKQKNLKEKNKEKEKEKPNSKPREIEKAQPKPSINQKESKENIEQKKQGNQRDKKVEKQNTKDIQAKTKDKQANEKNPNINIGGENEKNEKNIETIGK